MPRRFLSSWITLGALALLVAGCSDDNQTTLDQGPAADAALDSAPADAGPEAAPDQGPEIKDVQIPGLTAAVSATYDENGLLHLSCQTDEDCVAALGYFHASNRFFFMDFVRRYMRGRLAGFVKLGDTVLKMDYTMRRLMTSADGTPIEELSIAAMDPDTRKLLERYAAGVNAWLADLAAGRNGAKLSVEYNFPALIKDPLPAWEPADSIAIGLYIMFDLGLSLDQELIAGEIASSVETSLAADLLSVQPVFDVYTVSESELSPARLDHRPKLDLRRFAKLQPLLRSARERLEQAQLFKTGNDLDPQGSNNWAVLPGRTTAGKALLANDPHLSLMNPSIFMPAELDASSAGSGTLHVAGATLPGLPMVAIGHNETLAWGLTTAYYDQNEVYVEQLNAEGTAVIFNGQEVPLTEKTFTFANAATGEPVEQTFKYVPHHGPLISEDPQTGKGLSLRWVVADGVTDLTALMGLNRSATVEEVPAKLAQLTGLDQNIVVIDTAGHLGWFPYAKIPQRLWASPTLPPWLPVPGDGTTEWDGYLPLSELPQLQDPQSGFVATANQAMTDARADGNPFDKGLKAFQSWMPGMGARTQRITDLLAAGGDQHTPETMLAIQSDTYSLLGELIVPALIASTLGATLDTATTDVVSALQDWDYTCPTGLATTDPEGAKDSDPTRGKESIGCSAFHVALYQLFAAAFDDEAETFGVTIPLKARLKLIISSIHHPETLQCGGSFWDDLTTADTTETQDEIMRAALTSAGALLSAWNVSPDDWRWGRIHTLSLRSIYDQFGLDVYNNGPYANDGGLLTVDTSWIEGQGLDMSQSGGATLRMVAEASADGITMQYQHSGGTSMDRKSPFYDQLLQRYLKNEPIDFPFGPGAVSDPAESIEVKPAE